jgi:DNA-binding transcriptional regulator YiaG
MFGYKCQECHQGTVRKTIVKDFPARFNRIPFIVPDAVVGVCDRCGAQHFNLQETLRWRRLFAESLEKEGKVLSPAEITELRQSLGLSLEDFATLIGSTRQDVSTWEQPDRSASPSRTADLMMRLVRAARDNGKIAVLDFLLNDARQAGVEIALNKNGKPHARQPRTASKVPPKPRRRAAVTRR